MISYKTDWPMLTMLIGNLIFWNVFCWVLFG
jgi:hypothetical protein